MDIRRNRNFEFYERELANALLCLLTFLCFHVLVISFWKYDIGKNQNKNIKS